jgi:hypothetical protein
MASVMHELNLERAMAEECKEMQKHKSYTHKEILQTS